MRKYTLFFDQTIKLSYKRNVTIHKTVWF